MQPRSQASSVFFFFVLWFAFRIKHESGRAQKRGRPGNTYHVNDIWWTGGGCGGRGPCSNNVLDFIIEHSNDSQDLTLEQFHSCFSHWRRFSAKNYDNTRHLHHCQENPGTQSPHGWPTHRQLTWFRSSCHGIVIVTLVQFQSLRSGSHITGKSNLLAIRPQHTQLSVSKALNTDRRLFSLLYFGFFTFVSVLRFPHFSISTCQNSCVVLTYW